MSIELAKFGGAQCQACSGSISRASYRYIEQVPGSFAGARAKQEHYHIACALQVMPLQLARDLAAFEGKLPNRAMLDRAIDLWHEAIANPDDDGPRIVLADLMQSLGDPRGELMALQLLPGGNDRIEALVNEHQGRWLGRHRDVALAAQFSRGLLSRLELSDARLPTNEHDPNLATVEDLLPGTAKAERYKRYVVAMTGLRRIEVWEEDSLDAFEQTRSPIVHVACAYPTLGLGQGLAELGARFLRACSRQPTLRSLALQVNAFDTIAKSSIFGRLTALTLVGRLRDTMPIWHSLPKTMAVTFTNAAKLAPLGEPAFGDLVLRHTEGTVVARASGQWVREPDGLVANLPSSVTRLEVEGTPAELASKLHVWRRPGGAAQTRSLEVVFVEPVPPSGIWRHP
jgi:uncharacterized protein (TIGR02996 family)